MKKTALLLLMLVLAGPVFTQTTGFFDDFEDGSVDTTINGSTNTLWKADHPGTFGISENGGFLNVAYNRTTESGEWDNFNFTPPEVINVSGNPVITLKIKSDVATSFTVKPIYSNDNDGWLSRDIPADNLWHTYAFDLVESNYSGALLTKIYMYFDGGSTDTISGNIQFDDFQIAGFTIKVYDLEATLVDSASVDLIWTSNKRMDRDHFNIYRSTDAGFTPTEANRIAQTSDTVYHDTGLDIFTTYHYLVSATDQEGREYNPTGVSIRTTTPGAAPWPEVLAENANPVGKYEKYELLIGMPNATYDNPYNPEEIDLRAWFWSPDGDSLLINGFYDNYKGADAWKIRFSANMSGTWEYQIFASDIDGTGYSERGSFLVEDTEHKGWIRISPDNPNYLMHDDGSSFYGLSVYYPWAVSEAGLDKLQAAGETTFGYVLTESSHVQLTLSDARGSLVETLVNEKMTTGPHKVQWDAREHPAGVYFCTLRTGKATITKRFVIL